MKTRLSVIIPTMRPKFLGSVLESLLAQQPASEPELEIVVVENGASSGRTGELVEQLAARAAGGTRVVYEFLPSYGANAARDFGCRRASGTLLAFLDDDCIADRAWAGSVLEAHRRHPRAGCIGGRVDLNYLEPPPPWLVGPFPAYLAAVAPPAGVDCVDVTQRETGYVVSANLSCRREMYEAIGGFGRLGAEAEDPRSFTNDEVLFLDAARERGDPGILLDGRIRAVHQIPPERMTVEGFENKQYRQGVFDYRYWLHRRDFDQAEPAFESDVEALYNTALLDKFLEVSRHLDLVRTLGLDDRAFRQFTAHYLRCRAAYLQGFHECLLYGKPLSALKNVR